MKPKVRREKNSVVQNIRGYRVTVTRREIDPAETAARRKVIIAVIARSLMHEHRISQPDQTTSGE